MKKLLILTDTYSHQVNGVTACLGNLCANLPKNIEVHIISSDDFITVPFIGYSEIHLSLTYPHQVYKQIESIKPDYIHIMTEGPIGLMGAYLCRKKNIAYTTTFHTKFPEYLHMRNRLVHEEYVHWYLRYIHGGAEQIFISNEWLRSYLDENGYKKIHVIPFGINHSLFFPGKKTHFQDLKSPILLYVGRIAVEKNIDDFLAILWHYTKIVVGDGPLLKKYQKKYPEVIFLGKKTPEELAEIYRSVDIFVFPSKTDTLWLVNLEAMASWLPVVAYDSENTRGIIKNGETGILVPEWEKLEMGIKKISTIQKESLVAYARSFTWEKYAEKFIIHQFPISKKSWI